MNSAVRFKFVQLIVISLLLCNVWLQPVYASEWLETLVKKHFVVSPPVEVFFAEKNNEKFLVVIAQADIKNNDRKSLVSSRTVAKSLAFKALNSFINGAKISSIETLHSQHKYIVIERDGNQPQRLQISDTTKYTELIIEKGEGFVRNYSEIADWSNADGSILFVSLALKL